MASYEQRLQSLGLLLDRRTMRDICITEVPGGVIVTGLARVEEAAGAVWRPTSFEVTDAEMASGRGSAHTGQLKRRWPF